jgi:alpha-glucosidase
LRAKLLSRRLSRCHCYREGQYYYHGYLKQQPDLNWRHPGVRASMLDVLRFWFDRGIDGFPTDALRQLIKDDQLRDNPPDPTSSPGQSRYDSLVRLYTTDRPAILDIVADPARWPTRIRSGC